MGVTACKSECMQVGMFGRCLVGVVQAFGGVGRVF